MNKYLTYFIIALILTLLFSFDNIINGKILDGSMSEEFIGFFLLSGGFFVGGGIVEKILRYYDIRWPWAERPALRFLADFFSGSLLCLVASVIIVGSTWAFFSSFGIPKNMDRQEQIRSESPDAGFGPRPDDKEDPGPGAEGFHPPPPQKIPGPNTFRPPGDVMRLPFGMRDRNLAEAYKYRFEVLFGSFVVFFVIFLFEESRLHAQRSLAQQLNSMQLAQDQMLSRLNALKGQINPHFMFNNLNTLAGLIHEDVERADNFIQALSKNLRYVLEQNKEILVPLNKELEFIQSYIHLQEERFGHKLKIDIQISEDALEYQIPALTLELLVENALKHNIVSSTKPLEIKIFNKADWLIVSNNYQPKEEHVISTGIGLKNLKEQLDMLGLQGATFGMDSGNYVAKIPMLKIPEINAMS